MPVLLGIDTGGTYTDAVVFDTESGVLASAKALTRRHDLSLGIRESLEQVLEPRLRGKIELVSLSTTLATNAIVEGQGGSICLILIGYPADALEQSRLGEVTAADAVVWVAGGHDAAGEEVRPLDLRAASKAVDRFAPKVGAFAVSGYFSVRNPSHENAVRGIIRERSGLPVTCGHELTSNLHASRRALTAALNARLISVLSDLIRAVQGMLAEKEVTAPLMVVRGDGSLEEAAFALEYPIETILSGPAASVVGSLYLSGKKEACVVDMGGTTTDIALVSGGKPLLNRDGATVGGWQTMVQAVRIHTWGLGGDSEVRLEEGGGNGGSRIHLGPRRLVPLSLLAHENPEVLEELRRLRARRTPGRYAGRYAMLQKSWEDRAGELGETQQRLLRRLAGGRPVALERLFQEADSPFLQETELGRLFALGYVSMAGFTPTDAAHVLGFHASWSREAAVLGAELLLSGRERLGQAESAAPPAAEDLCRRVIRQAVLQSGRAVVEAVLAERFDLNLESLPAVRDLFVDRALLGAGKEAPDLLGVDLRLQKPLVAIGAPVATYYPGVARSLHTKLVIPAHAEVANAVGAVVGSIMQTVRLLITPQEGGELYRVHGEDGVHDFDDLEQAAAFALREAGSRAEELARRAGAASVKVSTEREDHNALAAGDRVFVQSLITATATGRPHLAHDQGG